VADQERKSRVASTVTLAALQFWKTIRALMSTAAKVDVNQATMWFVCLVFLSVVLAPTAIMTLVMTDSTELSLRGDPDFAQRMVIHLIRGAGDEFSRLTNFITPVFALLAGLKSKTGAQSAFFALFVCLSLFGAVGSLLVEYYVLSPDGYQLFLKDKWVGPSTAAVAEIRDSSGTILTAAKEAVFGVVEWSQKAKTFYNTSFQTFLSFIAILLGLQAAGK
jgi:hypothetical protein